MDLELISFDRCPYVQRSVITLLHKKAPFKITYIDLADKPKWFVDISPHGKVPALRIDQEAVIFESAVINEFVDEVTPGRLLPEDPIRRAVCRSWIEYGSGCLEDGFRLLMARSREDFDAARTDLCAKLVRVERMLDRGPFFDGENFSLVDAAYAPLFMRLEIWRRDFDPYPRAELPKISAWSEALLALPVVGESVVPELPDRYREMVRQRGSYIAGLLAA